MRRSRIRARSKRQAKAQRALAALTPALVQRSHGLCEAQFSKYCTRGGSVPHHVLKRHARPGIHELHLILWTCSTCNGEIEDRPADARALGVSIESWERPRFLEWMAPFVESPDDAEHNFAQCLRDAQLRRCSFQEEFERIRLIFLAADAGEDRGVLGDYVWDLTERAS